MKTTINVLGNIKDAIQSASDERITTLATLGFKEVLQRIADSLEDADGDVVASIHNMLCDEKLVYVGDSLFEPQADNPRIVVFVNKGDDTQETHTFYASDVLTYYFHFHKDTKKWGDLTEEDKIHYSKSYLFDVYRLPFSEYQAYSITVNFAED